MLQKISKVGVFLGLLALLLVFIFLLGLLVWSSLDKEVVFNPPGLPLQTQDLAKIESFSSGSNMKEYLLAGGETGGYYGGMGRVAMPMMADSMEVEAFATNDMVTGKGLGGGGEAGPSRFSETNVQVSGIDEPDIVKTNGKQIFASIQSFGPTLFREDVVTNEQVEIGRAIMPPMPKHNVLSISAFPPKSLEVLDEVDQYGEMLLVDDILVVFSASNNKVYGFDISDPANLSKSWQVSLEENTYLKTARPLNDKIYLITSTHVTPDKVCPLKIMEDSKGGVELGCSYIYHPVTPISSDVTYSVSELDPSNGEVGRRTSFVGTYNSSVYMSGDHVYVSYYYPGDMVAFMAGFAGQNSDFLPGWLVQKIANLNRLDLSDQAKMTEMMYLMEKYMNGLSGDERLEVSNEMSNRMSDYFKENKRSLEKTGIAKISVDEMKVVSSGVVPGSLLNQFSMDEFEGNLRVATTIGQSGGMFFDGGESVSDVYVLDEKMKKIGEALDMGKTERIYAVRFVGERGFVVTFRQTDPFYVLDLSKPENPKITGELKIPGYSSYLHPLEENMILGIGKEGSKVKLSLFNVKDSSNPKEADKYMLDEYWSEAVSNHHTFLQDSEYGIFFLPGGKGGYVFSYKGNELSLEKAVSDVTAKRALFIDQYLYVVGEKGLVVLDEKTWERVGELEFFE